MDLKQKQKQKMKAGFQGCVCMLMFMSALFIIAKSERPFNFHLFMNRWTKIVSFYSSNKGNFNISYKMNKPWGHYAKLVSHKSVSTVLTDLHKVPRLLKFTETENRMVVDRS